MYWSFLFSAVKLLLNLRIYFGYFVFLSNLGVPLR